MSRSQVNVRISQNVLDRADNLCDKMGLNRGEFLRSAVLQYIEQVESQLMRNEEFNQLLDQLKRLDNDDLDNLTAHLQEEIKKRKGI